MPSSHETVLEKFLQSRHKSLGASFIDKSKQYDTFNSTKNVFNSIRNDITNKIKENLTTQGLVIRHVWDSILASTKTAWTSVQKSLPKTSMILPSDT